MPETFQDWVGFYGATLATILAFFQLPLAWRRWRPLTVSAAVNDLVDVYSGTHRGEYFVVNVANGGSTALDIVEVGIVVLKAKPARELLPLTDLPKTLEAGSTVRFHLEVADELPCALGAVQSAWVKDASGRVFRSRRFLPDRDRHTIQDVPFAVLEH